MDMQGLTDAERSEPEVKTKRQDQYLIGEWPQTHRARCPYLIEPVTILHRWDEIAREYLEEESLEPRYLLEPIGDHLLRIRPGDLHSFTEYARQFGLREFIDWVYEKEIASWTEIADFYEDGKREFNLKTVEAAWCHPDCVTAFRAAQQGLAEGYAAARRFEDGRAALRAVLSEGWSHSAFELELEFDEATAWVYERPRDIFARAWFELVDNVTDGRVPKECPVCCEIFTPSRAKHTFDKADCRAKDYDRRERKHPWYREKERRRKQRDRGRITDDQYQKWLADNPRPRPSKEEE